MTTSAIRVRPASGDDVGALARVQLRAVLTGYGHIFRSTLPEPTETSLQAEWRDILRSEEARVLLAETAEQEIIGTIVVCSDDACTGRVKRLHVDPAFWSRGIGELLMASGVEYLRGRGLKRAVLWVLQDNVRARQLYERLGWRCNERVTKPGPHGTKEVQYSLELLRTG